MDANIATSDSLKVSQNEDGSFTLEWDKDDPQWNFSEWIDISRNSLL